MSHEALIEAVKAGDIEKVKEGLGTDVDVNAPGEEQDWTALNYAAGIGDLTLVELLVGRGADVFKTGRDNRTPYKIAIAAGHADVARYLADAEEAAGGDTGQISSREHETRPYCKAYYLKDLREFEGWVETRTNWKESEDEPDGGPELTDEDVVFIHQDLTVTQSMFHNENVIMGEVTPAWREFCLNDLGFKVPSDFDLIPAKKVEETAPG